MPAIVQPAALLSITGAVPTVTEALPTLTSGPGSLSGIASRNAVRLDALGRAGAGAYGIDWDSNPASAVLPGLDLTVSSGLTLAIAAGQAVLDSVVQILAPTTKALTDNTARVYLWLKQDLSIVAVNNSVTAPVGACVFLGSCVTSAGAITEINGSGVLYYRGSTLVRQTADVTTPTDTPPAGLSFINIGSGAAWLWTGTAYLALMNPALTIEPNTAGSGSPNILIAAESGKVLTNEGATALNYHTLPTAAAGLVFEFFVQDADGIRVTANTGDTIRLAGSVSATAGRIDSTTVGSVVRLVAVNATEWVGTSIVGSWSVT